MVYLHACLPAVWLGLAKTEYIYIYTVYVGVAGMIYTVYDGALGGFSAKDTMHTPYVQRLGCS
jgi:hypothetical protein